MIDDDERDGHYRDRQGNPLTLREWAQLHERWEYRLIAETIIGHQRIVTVWNGFYPYTGGSDPRVFSSIWIVRKGDVVEYGNEAWHASEADALARHEVLVKAAGVLAGGLPS